MEKDKRLQVAVIAGAAHAARFKEKHFRASEQEIIQHITENMDEIIETMDEDFN